MIWQFISILFNLFIVILIVVFFIHTFRSRQNGGQAEQKERLDYMEKNLSETLKANGEEIQRSRAETQQFIQSSFHNLSEILINNQKQTAEMQDKRLAELSQQLGQRIGELNRQLNEKNETLQNTVNNMLVQVNQTLENRMESLQQNNEKKLDEMRATVDEKLQKTLEERIGQSFKVVSDRLEQVYKGLGEMQTLASGVGDLKKVLSNVKTRGILGEIQLGAILEQMLSPEQYEENIATKKGSAERVEFAVRLPGEEDDIVYLPIDAKFPADAYTNLLDAYDTGDSAKVESAAKVLESRIKSFAKDIQQKYIDPPHTTDFGIMFLPAEGLYAEVVRRGMVETLQREYKISIAGPTTMAALLNSLQMGFRTLAIQKHSSEVWNVLGAVKTEFEKFGGVLAQTQQRINQANQELDKLVGTRTRKIQSKLKNVTALPESSSQVLLGLDQPEFDEGKGEE